MDKLKEEVAEQEQQRAKVKSKIQQELNEPQLALDIAKKKIQCISKLSLMEIRYLRVVPELMKETLLARSYLLNPLCVTDKSRDISKFIKDMLDFDVATITMEQIKYLESNFTNCVEILSRERVTKLIECWITRYEIFHECPQYLVDIMLQYTLLTKLEWKFQSIDRQSKVMGAIADWIIACVNIAKVLHRIQPLQGDLDRLNVSIASKYDELQVLQATS
ncbi:hypothetical protein RFI_01340 [Reticulomyxa filosa]|uniref:Uncharacterized protein n=1 Tax=Reticulomyxa filosa TaxID=46433 RepID=X6PAZ7_RETFI|nr:hypothetical protein RFI_01340 [Reticulomyxa filosa]|eukprot:ETO35720.1 hypothetical protein RFI_01340 [Reticulomyxa filosa]